MKKLYKEVKAGKKKQMICDDNGILKMGKMKLLRPKGKGKMN